MPTPQPPPAKPSTQISTTPKNLAQEIPDIHHQLPPLPSPLPPQHPDFHYYKPPTPPTYPHKSVFLAGSIEMGSAIQWQSHIVPFLHDLPITLCNPRRSTWDSAPTPAQRQADMEFQVSWELAALDACDVICFFFDWATMSPVTMMELGLWARSGKCVVCCDDGEGRFWKGTNVRMVCERYGVPHVRRFEDLVGEVRKMLVKKGMKMDGAVEKEKEERDGESEKEERDEEGGVAI